MQQEIWKRFLECARETTLEGSFASWFAPMRCQSMTDDSWIIALPNVESFNWVSTMMMGQVNDCAAKACGHPVNIQLICDSRDVSQFLPGFSDESLFVKNSASVFPATAAFQQGGVQRPVSSDRIEVVERPMAGTSLNPDYTFENFVVGGSNEFAHAAAKAVADNPASSYNPLFLYGGVGLGKTHLMHAIGNELHRKFGMRVLYLTSEQFTNDVITGISRKEMPEFRERFRSQCDVLLIDDIQFIAGKDATQEEFFHTFNVLYNSHKQIVLTSDKPPQEIQKLEERLQSRFGGGLIADIQAPDLETKVAILQRKAVCEKIVLPNDVAHYIAGKVTSNVRELEGCLKRVVARAQLTHANLNIAVAAQVVDPYVRQRSQQMTPENIIEKVCLYYHISKTDLLGKSRAKPIVYPRQIATYLIRMHTKLSLPEIGRFMGRDHTTVMSSIDKIQKLIASDSVVASDLETLQRMFIY